ncbi:MAG TPA: FAD-dependent oxidoreductase [Ktedonobacterales bacterium]|nr:FAD-dependent oxidoreductase [Ktedonobacterales bacterium]
MARFDAVRDVDFLIIGAGVAGATAAEEIRSRDARGSIVLVNNEVEYPYHRPPLSKEFLRGEIATEGEYGAGGVRVRQPEWYRERHIEVLRGVAAADLDTPSHMVLLVNGQTLRYRRLLLATGGVPQRPAVPGADLRGVYSLRTLEDADAIRAELLTPNRRAVIIGARFIGLETAASAIQKAAHVTVVDNRARVWPDLLSPALSEYILSLFTSRGARLRYGYAPTAILPGAHGRVAAVRIASVRGNAPYEDIPCDFVILGLGIALNTQLAESAEIRTEPGRGILVNEQLETSAADVFAAGDVITYPDSMSGWMHFEHWDHAIASAKTAARNMVGAHEEYTHVPYFFSDLFDLSINMVGYPLSSPTVDLVIRGNPAAHHFTALYLDRGRLRAALTVNDDAHLDLLRNLIATQAPLMVDTRALAHPGFDLAALQSRLHAER